MHLSRQTTRHITVLLITALLSTSAAKICAAHEPLCDNAQTAQACYETTDSAPRLAGHTKFQPGERQAPDACYLDLILALQYLVQTAIFMGFFIADPVPQGNLIAALLTYLVAMNRLEDYRTCIAGQEPQ